MTMELEERVEELETQLKEMNTELKLLKTAAGELVDKHNDVVTALEELAKGSELDGAKPTRKRSGPQTAPFGINPASLRFIASESRQWLQLLFGSGRRR